MTQFVYDGTFAGLLTAIFEVFEHRAEHAVIARRQSSEGMIFGDNLSVITDTVKAGRVWKGLEKKLSNTMLKNIYWSFLSELKDIEDHILELVRYVFNSTMNVEDNFGHPAVLTISQTARKVGREKHRFEAFVRFGLIGEGFFYAPIDPDFNVLPIILPHFKSRYADQHWIIYDTRRHYGIHYDKDTEQVHETVIDFSSAPKEEDSLLSFDPEEQKYQDLWRGYFKSTNIPLRKNTKLHLRHVPKRYWKYLAEKKEM